MEDARLALNKIDDLLSKWKEDRESDSIYYSAINNVVNHLQESSSLTNDRKIKLKKIHWHLNSMFGADHGNGHDFEQHWVWAYGIALAIRSL
jgi:hypothetical protein